eukprot:scaffold91176_cov63-Phaeocystis_antarctica.AAC.3
MATTRATAASGAGLVGRRRGGRCALRSAGPSRRTARRGVPGSYCPWSYLAPRGSGGRTRTPPLGASHAPAGGITR